jgi:hypothetical protein
VQRARTQLASAFVVQRIEDKAKELEQACVDCAATAGKSFQSMESPLHILLMKWLWELAGVDDRAVPEL